MAHQDWKVVVLTKSPAKRAPTGQKQLALAIKKGEVEVLKRFNAGKNTSLVAAKGPTSATKLENETSDFKHPQVTHELKMALQQARVAKKMSQSDLAKTINVKVSVIQDYESGKAIPAPTIISKFNRALGVVLPKIAKKKTLAPEDETKAPAKVKA